MLCIIVIIVLGIVSSRYAQPYSESCFRLDLSRKLDAEPSYSQLRILKSLFLAYVSVCIVEYEQV